MPALKKERAEGKEEIKKQAKEIAALEKERADETKMHAGLTSGPVDGEGETNLDEKTGMWFSLRPSTHRIPLRLLLGCRRLHRLKKRVEVTHP